MAQRELSLRAEAVRNAITSISACNQSTVEQLATLLGDCGVENTKPALNVISKGEINKMSKSSTGAKNKGRLASSLVVREDKGRIREQLEASQAAKLAADVVNETLKVLTLKVKEQVVRQQDERPRSPKRPMERHSNVACKESAQPLQPRTPNLAYITPSSKPNAIAKSSRPASSRLSYLDAIAECSRLAFSYLRKTQTQKGTANTVSSVQVDTGSSALVGKLLALGLEDHATRELWVLIERLSPVRSTITSTKNSTVQKKAGTSTSNLPSLLATSSIPSDPKQISLLITSQIQVLKLLTIAKKAAYARHVAENVDVRQPASVFNCIQRLLDTHKSELSVRALQQLEQAADLIGSLCHDKNARQETGVAEDADRSFADCNLRLAVSCCVIQQRYWDLTGRSEEKLIRAWTRLKYYIQEYMRLTQEPSEEKYVLFKNIVAPILSLEISNSTLHKWTVKSRETFIGIYDSLAELAFEAKQNVDADDYASRWLAELRLSSASGASVCAALATLELRSIKLWIATPSKDKCFEGLENIEQTMNNKVSGTTSEFESMIRSVALLLRALPRLLKLSFEKSGYKEVLDRLQHSLHRIAHQDIRLLHRFVSGLSGYAKNDDTVLSRQLQLSSKIAVSVFEVFGHMSHVIDPLDVKSWLPMEESLQICVKTANEIERISKEQDISLYESFQDAFVLLSNVYWSLFQAFKKAGSEQTQCRSTLRRSINVLQQRTSREKESGFIHTKLERLCGLYEAANDYGKGLEVSSHAVVFAIESAASDSKTEVVNKVSPSIAAGQVEKLGTLDKLLAMHSRIWQKSNSKDTSILIPMDSTEPHLRGFVLELQFATLSNATQERSNSTNFLEALQRLAGEVLDVYRPDKFPLRRLRAMALIKRAALKTHYPQLASMNSAAGDTCDTRNPASDSDFVGIKDHLVAQENAYSAMLNPEFAIDLLQKSLDFWKRLLEEFNGWQELKNKVGDLVDWIMQLETISEFLNVHDFQRQRATVLHILHRIQAHNANFDIPLFVSKACSLGDQLLKLDFVNEAKVYFEGALAYINSPQLPPLILLEWYFGYASLLLRLGEDSECMRVADKYFLLAQNTSGAQSGLTRVRDREQQLASQSKLYILKARLASSTSQPIAAVYNLKKALKAVYRSWALLERYKQEKPKSLASGAESDSLSDSVSNLAASQSRSAASADKYESLKSLPFWSLSISLFELLLDISSLLSCQGLLHEAQHYLDNAKKIATAVGSNNFQRKIAIHQSRFDTSQGKAEDGKTRLKLFTGEASSLPFEVQALLHLALANASGAHGDLCDAGKRLKVAEMAVQVGTEPDFLIAPTSNKSVNEISDQLEALQITNKKVGLGRKLATTAAKSRPPVAKKAAVRKVQKASKEVAVTYPPLVDLKAKILHSKLALAMQAGDLETSECLVLELKQLSLVAAKPVHDAFSQSKLAFQKGLRNLALDPVFGLLLESTISCPSICTTNPQIDTLVEQPATNGKRSVSTKKTKAKSTAQAQITKDYLDQAFDALYQIQESAQLTLSSSELHKMTDIMRKSLMTLSSTSAGTTNSMVTAFAMELGRSVAFQKEAYVIQTEKLLSASQDYSGDMDTALSLPVFDIDTFKRDYIDIIPPAWTVVSLSISQNSEELVLSRLRPNEEPFIIAIPLQRHKPDECEEEMFGFEEGKAELKEIIDLANFSTHDAGDTTRKGAKTEWWEARAALDSRLKDLLVNIENIWLGGFRGLLSQHVPQLQLLLRFEQSLTNILEKHLPSRRKGGKKAKSSRLVLDQSVLSLFIGLGRPSDNPEIEEPLMDLLYFVVDIFQFHGERNAYDEIDFDPIVLEVIDALSHYHDAASESTELDSRHTILILDKALHAFPWESLPCIDGQAVSRLPSLGALRDRILKQNQSFGAGITVDATDGAFVLNPGGDLKSTEATFVPPLSQLTSWSSTIKKPPTEDELVSHLSGRSIYLYFGHGSGGQYVRARKIRELDRCAVALLMGCSSGMMTEAGEFESYGTPLNYMHAGAPAMMGTLWDVTDKDIDRFSTSMLQKWGLFEEDGSQRSGSGASSRSRSVSPVKRDAKGKGKGRGRPKSRVRVEADEPGPEPEPADRMSLDKAVAQSRGSCIFKYLNGAAPVVYGVPVYLG